MFESPGINAPATISATTTKISSITASLRNAGSQLTSICVKRKGYKRAIHESALESRFLPIEMLFVEIR